MLLLKIICIKTNLMNKHYSIINVYRKLYLKNTFVYARYTFNFKHLKTAI